MATGGADTTTSDSPLVSIVVRTLGDRPPQLRRALGSLAAATHRPLQVVLVYQGTSPEILEGLDALSQDYPSIDLTVIQNPTSADDRAQNLNLGWQAALGRYVGFLDDDDTVESKHVERLVAAMSATGATWSYGQCLLTREAASGEPRQSSFRFYRRAFSLRELLIENFIPIHSFLVDRERLDPQLRHDPFYRPLARSEDWDFLIRLAYRHEPAIVREHVCTYFVAVDGGNTNISLTATATPADPERAGAWAASRAIVLDRVRAMLAGDPRRADLLAALNFGVAASKVERAIRRLDLWWSRAWFTAGQQLRTKKR